MDSSVHTATYQKLIMLPGPTNVPIEVTQAMVAPSIGHRTSGLATVHLADTPCHSPCH